MEQIHCSYPYIIPIYRVILSLFYSSLYPIRLLTIQILFFLNFKNMEKACNFFTVHGIKMFPFTILTVLDLIKLWGGNTTASVAIGRVERVYFCVTGGKKNSAIPIVFVVTANSDCEAVRRCSFPYLLYWLPTVHKESNLLFVTQLSPVSYWARLSVSIPCFCCNELVIDCLTF